MITRRNFLTAAGAAAAASIAGGAAASDVTTASAGDGIRVRFLGSGAASWDPKWLKKWPYARRNSSVLLENAVMIDCSRPALDLMPAGCRPQALFLTHSHGDHYYPPVIAKSGVKRVYAHESWAAAARAEIAEAARAAGTEAPEVRPLRFGAPVEECGMRFTCVPSIHSTSRVTDGTLERTGMYLVEKGTARLLYATDTASIPGDAARMIGIDLHIGENSPLVSGKPRNPYVARPKPITAFIMEATDGISDSDFRMFVHSSVQNVARIADMLKKTGRFTPPAGQHVYLTHLALRYRNWPAAKIDAELPAGLRAASDGLELFLG